MRRRAWVAWGCLAVGILLGLLGRLLPGEDAWNLPAGLALLLAIALGLSLLRFWHRLAPNQVPMPDLFESPRPGERWCVSCGHPTAQAGPCRLCGATLPSRATPPGRLQAK